MERAARLIWSIVEFRESYPDLRAGDAVLGPLALRPGEEFKLLDLAERGVALFPPALAQLLARSKAAQAEALGQFMVPGTFVAYGLTDLAANLSRFASRHGGAVVTKRDRGHLGLGVGCWPSL
ncbi:MAG: hypothetical protein WB948_00985, partial [Desulfobaccales bacterium]